jgi:triacylglycerol lipase
MILEISPANTSCEKNPEIDFPMEIVKIGLVYQGEEYMTADWKWNEPQINLQNADVLGRAAHLAYKEAEAIGKELQEWDMKLVQFFDRQNTQAYLAKNDQTCILVFRGTQPNKIRDWLYDLDSRFVSPPMGMVGRVHAGFLHALNAVWPEVWATLQKERGTRSLWITGHSLGGALAVLATARLRFSKAQPINGLYTYGQPRVGDPEFCTCFNQGFGKSTFRFVNYHDIVPRVPLRNMGYEHQGKFFFFNVNKYDPDMTWDKVLLRKVGNTIREIVDTNDISDHYMDNYLLKLKRLADSTNFHDV